MNSVEIFSIIKDIALASAAGTTALVAYTGLEKWQKELRGKANFEVARELIKSVYIIRDELSYCRSPFTAAAEFPEDYKGALGKHTPEEKGQAWAHVYSRRWKSVGKAVQDFDTAVLEAEALWGPEIKKQATELRQCVSTLQVNIESYIQNAYSDGEDFKDREYMKLVQAGIWDSKSEDNELTNRINSAIIDLESDIRPHLARS